MSKPIPKPKQHKLLVKVIFVDGTYEIFESPSRDIDSTIWLFRQLGYNARNVERIEKCNFD